MSHAILLSNVRRLPDLHSELSGPAERREVSKTGARRNRAQHLVLGVITAAHAAIERFASRAGTIDGIHERCLRLSPEVAVAQPISRSD
jgi:hypothetical protein